MQRNQIWACPEEGTGVGQRGQRTTAGQLQAPGGQEEHGSSHILGQFASQLLILGDVEVLGWSRFVTLFLACFKSIEIGRFSHEANQPSLHQASQKTGSLIHPAFLLVPAKN